MSLPAIDVRAAADVRPSGSRRLTAFQSYGLAILSVGLAVGAALLIQQSGFREATVPLLLFAGAITSW